MAQINSNRTFVEFRAEEVWGDEGADVSAGTGFNFGGVSAAATQLSLNAVPEPSVMTGLIQPSGARRLTLTIVDGDVSINAFDITVVGVDQNGGAVSENFLFAGGLVQTTTAYLKSVTSITLTSITGNGAADTLDAAWGAVVRMADKVAPASSKVLKIAITDANSSINAFQIDAVGVDVDGNAVTQQFLFAGGLSQTGTSRFASLTTVTLTSQTGGTSADSILFYWAAPAVLIPVLDGDYGVGLDDPTREQQHVQGDQDAQYTVQDRRNLAGSLKVGVWPHLTRTLLDLATVRTSGETGSVCLRDTIPGIETRVHAGLKVESLTIEGSSEGDVTFSFDLKGRHEDTEAEISYPGSYTVPEIPSLTFKNSRYIISLNAGEDDDFDNRISPVGLSSFSLTHRNNLKEGPPVEDRIDLEKDGRPEYLTAGRKSLEVRFTASFDRQAYMTMKRQKLLCQIKMVGAHPQYASYGEVAANASAGSAVAVTLLADPSAWLSVGDYVLFDNYMNLSLPCVGRVTVITPGTPSITIATLDEAVKDGDHVFAGAVEFRTAPIRVSTAVIQRNFDDTLMVEVSGQAFSGGAAALTYKARNLALPA